MIDSSWIKWLKANKYILKIETFLNLILVVTDFLKLYIDK